jgi:hypothetical protein
MARKKRKTFRAVKAVKAAARAQLGTPPPTRRREDSRPPQRPKHKPTLRRLLEEAE